MTELTDLFCALARIPSPSMQEDAVAEQIVSYFHRRHIAAQRDDFGNIYAEIPATDPAKPSLMLSAHMDVVGDSSPVNIILRKRHIENGRKKNAGG